MSRTRDLAAETEPLREDMPLIRPMKNRMPLHVFSLILVSSFLFIIQNVQATPLTTNDSSDISKVSNTVSADAAMVQIATLVKRGLLNEAEIQLEKLYAENLDSPSIHLLRADLLSKLGRPDEARRALEIAYKFTPDNLEVLKKVAASRDANGDQAAIVYEELANKLENENAPSSDVLEALDRGLVVAIRDGESATALRLSQKLHASGRPTILQSAPNQNSGSNERIEIPGGIKALARMAGMQEPKTPDTFLTQYAERLARLQDKTDFSDSLPTFRGLHEYFKIIIKLQSLTGSRKEASEISLDTNDKPRQELNEKILFLLGWQIKKQSNRRVLERDERPVLAYRKKVSEALGIKDDEFKATLESGKSFIVNVPTDLVPVQINENYWTTGLLNGSKSPGGLGEAFLETLPAAYLYVALSKLNKETQVQIIQSFNPKTLLKEHWKTLYLYGSALNINGTQVETPGGPRAAEAWERLVGANHRKVAPFLNALFSRDAGRLMAFYYVLSGLPTVNQQFFTRNSRNLEILYKSFALPGKNSPGADSFLRRNTIFHDVARELPLNESGDVRFPGGSSVWKLNGSERKKSETVPAPIGTKSLKGKKGSIFPSVESLKQFDAQESNPFPLVDTLEREDKKEETISAPVDFQKKDDAQGNGLLPSTDSLVKEEKKEEIASAAVDLQKKDDAQGNTLLPSADSVEKEDEKESIPSAPADSPRKVNVQGNNSSPSVNRPKKFEDNIRDPFPSIEKLKKVEILEIDSAKPANSIKKSLVKESTPFPSANSLKKVDVQESAPFLLVAPLKKIDANETVPIPVRATLVQKEKDGDSQREPETRILAEMFSSRDEAGREMPTRLEAFLAIVRLEKHWGKALNQDSVSLLLENFMEHKQLFPYLASLPPLETHQLREFFQAVGNLESLKSSNLALIAGDFQCFLKLLSLLYENGAMPESQASGVLKDLCQRYATVRTDAEFARASFLVLDSLKNNLQVAVTAIRIEKPALQTSGDDAQAGMSTSIETTNNDVDELLFAAFAGVSNITRVNLGGGEIEVDLSGWKKKRMQEVMALQAIPLTDPLLKIFQCLDTLGNEGLDSTTLLQSVDNMVAGLRDVDGTLWESVPKNLRLNMLQLHREKILRSLSFLKTSMARDVSPNERKNLASNVILELHPSLHLSLLGWIYAYHFSPNDLLIKEDPLFIRRHRFLASSSQGKSIWHNTDIDSLDPDSGSYLRGGVAQVAAVAGEIGLVTDQAAEAMGRDQKGAKLAAAQLAALRAIPWRKWNSRQLHSFCLKVRLGKELLAQASIDPELLAGISEDLRVLVGPKRCRILLQGLPGSASSDSVGLLSSEELFVLADRYWKKKGPTGWWKSPLADQLAREEPIPTSESIAWIGGYYPQSYGCGHTHMLSLGPYEEYENVKNPELISERLSQVILDLAEKIDRLGLPLEILPLLAEPAVRHLAMTKWMSDWSDWQSALEGLRELRLEPLISHLQENP